VDESQFRFQSRACPSKNVWFSASCDPPAFTNYAGNEHHVMVSSSYLKVKHSSRLADECEFL
ncbi:hypothetical protein PENTCL1PPCAC_19443, partial [Pristionchus entomophagus]